MNTELAKVETALTEFGKIEAGLAELRTKFANVVFPVATPAGMKDALAARAVIRKPRYLAEEIRKNAKAPILELGRSLDSRAKYITAELLKIEEPIQAQIAVEENRKEQAILAEQARVNQITQCITDLHMIVSSMAGKSAAEIEKRIADITEYDLTEWAQEFIPQAEKARAAAVAGLEQLHAGAVAKEREAAAEEARFAAERAELARLRAEQDERNRTEQARIAEETRVRAEAEAKARAVIEAEQRASREKIEAAERAARLVREEADRAARQAREAEEAKERQERAARQAEADRVAKEQAERDRILKAESDRLEAEKREIERQQNELLDGAAMLEKFVERFGRRREFAAVVRAIENYLQNKAA